MQGRHLLEVELIGVLVEYIQKLVKAHNVPSFRASVEAESHDQPQPQRVLQWERTVSVIKGAVMMSHEPRKSHGCDQASGDGKAPAFWVIFRDKGLR